MGITLVVIGVIFLLGGLAISLWEAFKDSRDKLNERQSNLNALMGKASLGGDEQIKITKELIEALKDLLEVFGKLAAGIQVSLIGLLLVYWGTTLL